MSRRWKVHHISGALLIRSAVLGGSAALHHRLIQLLAVEDDREEVNLPLRLGLVFLRRGTSAEAPAQPGHTTARPKRSRSYDPLACHFNCLPACTPLQSRKAVLYFALRPLLPGCTFLMGSQHHTTTYTGVDSPDVDYHAGYYHRFPPQITNSSGFTSGVLLPAFTNS